ncbi:MAG: NAD(P)-dependent oxidoreductase [Alphaproteobacteria bacterium]
MANTTKVGWIGVGLMGHGAARNILEKGFPLTVMAHRNRQPVDDLVGRGAAEAATPAAVAEACDVTFLCLPSSREVDRVVLGADGVASAIRPGSIVVDCTTAEPDETLRVGAALAEVGATLVDAPFTRTPKEAEEGRLNVLVGASDEALARVRPVLETFTENIFHIGGPGMGHRIKLFNNAICMAIAAANAEAIAAAAKLGIDLDMLHDVITTGGGDSRVFRSTMRWVLDGDDSLHRGTLWVGAKDMRAFLRMTAADDVPTPIIAHAAQSFTLANALGHGDRFIPVLPQVIASRYGAHIRDIED